MPQPFGNSFVRSSSDSIFDHVEFTASEASRYPVPILTIPISNVLSVNPAISNRGLFEFSYDRLVVPKTAI